MLEAEWERNWRIGWGGWSGAWIEDFGIQALEGEKAALDGEVCPCEEVLLRDVVELVSDVVEDSVDYVA